MGESAKGKKRICIYGEYLDGKRTENGQKKICVGKRKQMQRGNIGKSNKLKGERGAGKRKYLCKGREKIEVLFVAQRELKILDDA